MGNPRKMSLSQLKDNTNWNWLKDQGSDKENEMESFLFWTKWYKQQ